MRSLQPVLLIFTVLIFGITFCAVAAQGFNWPVVFLGDQLQLNWRSQFNSDFLMHLLLLAAWAWWREGGGIKGIVIGFLCVIWGGMFTFPYFLYLIIRNKGDVAGFFYGVHTPVRQA